MDEKLWLKSTFSIDSLPNWVCPTCMLGKLVLDKKDFVYSETFNSIQEHQHPEWEPDWVSYRFGGLLKCSNPDCFDIVSFCGRGQQNYNMYYDEFRRTPKEHIFDTFTPEYFIPSLQFFKISSNCPNEIKNEIFDAFNLYWNDENACANKIRVILELLMNDKKVVKTVLKRGKRIKLSLHQRIEEFKNKEEEIASHLLAIKWIGNVGSHVGKIEKIDLIDAFQLLEYSIEYLYENKSKSLNKLTKEISKKKGPRSKSKTSPF